MCFRNLIVAFSILTSIIIFKANAQNKDERDTTKEGYVFTIEKQIETTPVKDQNKSGTCWSFCSLSFIETEMLRMGKDMVDLSEMFIVRHTYLEKAIRYVRYHGNVNFSAGGALHDVPYIIRKYGIVPEEVYPGLNIGEDKHVHGEMAAVLKGILDAVIKKRNGKLTPVWLEAFESVLDVYLGKFPENFTYKGKAYTPESFAKNFVGINPDDYIEITSYTHHPFYKKFILEVPDNWTFSEVYNVPIDEFAQIFDHAINNGYSISWGSDVSDKGFKFKEGLAIMPLKDWDDMSDEEKDSIFSEPGPEKEITQEMRQESYDNYTTTDDHGMHITGIAKDQNGTKYYLVKNSWGTEDSEYEGYFYASEAFILYKTIDIMVHKNAILKNIARKLGL